MENASKALLMAAGILVGVLILALMATLFINSKNVNAEYERNKQAEAVQQFNVNFTKYVGRDITIHDAISITNFAQNNKMKTVKVNNKKDITDITKENLDKNFKLTINSYDDNGYISEVTIS